MGVDDCDLPNLGQSLGSTLDHRLVDPFFDDLMANVIGSIRVEAAFVRAKTDRKRRVLD